jgi:hypothetical protein
MIIGLLLCLVVMLTLHLITPYWWWVVAAPLLYGILKARSARNGLFVGMLSAGILWLGGSLYYWRTGGEIITQRLTDMVQIGSPWVLIGATALAGLLAGGIAGLTGYLARASLCSKR